MIKAYCKRVLLFLPFLVCYFIALGLSMLTIIVYASEFLFEEESEDSILEVACYVPDDEAYTRLGLNFFKQMDSVRHTIDIEIVDSREEVVSMVEDKDAVAGIIVPEGFIETMGTPDAVQASIIYRDANTFDEYMVNDLIYAISDFFGTSQCAIITAGEYARQMGIDDAGAYSISYTVQDNCFEFFLARKTLFQKIDADDLVAKFEVREQMVASYSLYIIMMSIFIISFFFKGNNEVFRARAKLSGIGNWKLFLVESGCAAFMMYFLYFIMFVILFATFHTLHIAGLFTTIPFILILALAGTGLCYLVKSPSTVSYISFGAGTALMYLAGGLLPLDYMPHFFQLAAVYNPFYYLITFFMRAMYL